MLSIKGVVVQVLSHVNFVFQLIGEHVLLLSLGKRVFELLKIFVVILADNNFALLVLGIALVLVVLTEVAVLADTLGVEQAVSVLAFCGKLSSTFGVIAVLAHSVGVVGFIMVAALVDLLAVLLYDLSLFHGLGATV